MDACFSGLEMLESLRSQESGTVSTKTLGGCRTQALSHRKHDRKAAAIRLMTVGLHVGGALDTTSNAAFEVLRAGYEGGQNNLM